MSLLGHMVHILSFTRAWVHTTYSLNSTENQILRINLDNHYIQIHLQKFNFSGTEVGKYITTFLEGKWDVVRENGKVPFAIIGNL
uniref:Uncharacterized protein n=1 Tax=Oryza brachyantha TaxID=4533 RepID=J3LPL2_ORYBR